VESESEAGLDPCHHGRVNDQRELHRRLHEVQVDLLGRLRPGRDEYLERLQEGIHPGYVFPWRVAESPAIVSREVFELDVATMRRLLAPYFTTEFRGRYQDHVPARFRRPDDSGWFPRFVATDFQRAFDSEQGCFTWGVPEIQSFPGNLLLKPEMLRRRLGELPGFSEADLFPDPDITTFDAYVDLLREIVLGRCEPGETAILELDPGQQTTLVDMLLFAKHLSVPIVNLRDVTVDDVTGEAWYRSAITFQGDVPRLQEESRPRRLRRILCRALPDEIDDALKAGRLDPLALARLFQGTLERKTAEWVVHPQDFFVLSKETLVGNPQHRPALRPVTADLSEELERDGLKPSDGVVKPFHRAGGRGLVGLDGALDAGKLGEMARSDPGGLVWQARYAADGFSVERIPGYAPASIDEHRPLYHELRLMWSAEAFGALGVDVNLRLLSGLSRWARVGDAANARFQRMPFTGTQGILVTPRGDG